LDNGVERPGAQRNVLRKRVPPPTPAVWRPPKRLSIPFQGPVPIRYTCKEGRFGQVIPNRQQPFPKRLNRLRKNSTNERAVVSQAALSFVEVFPQRGVPAHSIESPNGASSAVQFCRRDAEVCYGAPSAGVVRRLRPGFYSGLFSVVPDGTCLVGVPPHRALRCWAIFGYFRTSLRDLLASRCSLTSTKWTGEKRNDPFVRRVFPQAVKPFGRSSPQVI
jgi:hypothetical protein